ncbi:MAG: hypothetical protein AAB495_02075 [Patescibacteria group bacterium]
MEHEQHEGMEEERGAKEMVADEEGPVEDLASAKRMESGKTVLIGSAMISFAILVFAGTLVYTGKGKPIASQNASAPGSVAGGYSDPLEEAVIPSGGVYIPVRWGDAGKKLVESGVLDRGKFDSLYADRGGLTDETKKLLERSDNERIVITPENSGQVLNLLWAFGLANNNPILDYGPMRDPSYGGADRFASTGGWTLAKGNVMDHYSRHAIIELTSDQQKLVEKVAKGIYRPCCGNATYFPDCNHGMAMLGLLELMASQGVSEENMYRAALKVNSYWFPETYMTLARYFANKGVSWDAVDPKEVLGEEYSSASGYRQILSEVTEAAAKTPAVNTPTRRSSGGCGV